MASKIMTYLEFEAEVCHYCNISKDDGSLKEVYEKIIEQAREDEQNSRYKCDKRGHNDPTVYSCRICHLQRQEKKDKQIAELREALRIEVLYRKDAEDGITMAKGEIAELEHVVNSKNCKQFWERVEALKKKEVKD